MWAPWTQNLYVYVGNNPINYTDPTGHCTGTACVPYAWEVAKTGPLGQVAALAVLAWATLSCGLNSTCRAEVAEAVEAIDAYYAELGGSGCFDALSCSYATKRMVDSGAYDSTDDTTWYASSNADMTAQQIIGESKKGAINREFPGSMKDKTLKEIERLAKQGDKDAQSARKLLTDKRFDKTDNRK